MIGLDTNIVLRWLVADDNDAVQSRAALRAIEQADAIIFVNDIVIAETAWVLAARYKQSRHDVVAGFKRLLAHPMVRVSNTAAVLSALSAYELGGAGLSDHLIGTLNTAAGCKTTLTFDKGAAKGPHFTQL
jgi:predicted nucleic-acid-binding protein